MKNFNQTKNKIYFMKFGLKAMLALEAIFMFSGGIFGPLYALFIREVGGSILDVGIASSIFLIVTGILTFIISRWENRLKHQEKLYLLGYLLTAISYLGYIFVTNRTEIFILQMFLGISQAIYLPVRDSLFTKFLDKGEEAKEWGEWETEAYIVPAFAALLGAWIAANYGFKNLFFIMSLISLAGVALGLKFFSLRKKSKRRSKK